MVQTGAMGDTSMLPEGVAEWIGSVGGGTITRLDRAVARREAWIVDITAPDGSVTEAFLRLQRNSAGPDPRRLEREAAITDALGGSTVPVVDLLGWNGDLQVALFGRDPGRSDIDELDDARQQRAIMEDFIRVVADFHTMDPASLGIDDVMGPVPATAHEAALGVVDMAANGWKFFLDEHRDPVLSYAVDWLYRFVPTEVDRVCLVQGDTGPVNFMFQGDRVSSVIDWEEGHWGDPMEDLGNIRCREMWNPCGGLDGLFTLYEELSGIPYDRTAALYYSVHQSVRGLIPIHYVSEHGHPEESLSRYLCYRYLTGRSSYEAIAEAMEIELTVPEFPDDGEPHIIAADAIATQRNHVTPALDDPFLSDRANDVASLIACMDRRARLGPLIDEIEIEEMAPLLGFRADTARDGSLALHAAIAERSLADEPLVHYLARRAYREEWLHQPAVDLYPDRRWAPID